MLHASQKKQFIPTDYGAKFMASVGVQSTYSAHFLNYIKKPVEKRKKPYTGIEKLLKL